jgi:hypothetical protein
MQRMDQKYFLELLGGFVAAPVEDVFEEYKTNPKLKWYHLICSVADFPLLWSCKDFKFYSLCRCHQVANDGSIAHEHIHAVVSGEVLLSTWKQRLCRKKIKLNKTTFKKIICGDHLCGVLRYICCRDGQKVGRRGNDGLASSPHTHYERRVDVQHWLHKRPKGCARTRDNIERKMMLIADGPLHDYETCICHYGKIGQEKRKEANRKRKAFYETDEGKQVKQKYKRRKQTKDDIIAKLVELGAGGKAELLRMEIRRLVELM